MCSKIDLGRDPCVFLCEGLKAACGAWVSVVAAVLHQPKAARRMRCVGQSVRASSSAVCCRALGGVSGGCAVVASRRTDGKLLLWLNRQIKRVSCWRMAYSFLVEQERNAQVLRHGRQPTGNGRSDAHRVFSDAPVLFRVCERANEPPYEDGPKKQVLAKARCKERVGR